MHGTDARHRWLFAIAILSLAVSGGCLHAQAKTPGPEPAPALSVPEPPTRLLLPVPPESLLPPPPAPTETPVPAAPGRPPAPRPTPTPTTTPPTNPSTPPVDPPPPVLQTGSSLAILEAQARERLDHAEKDLARVKVDALTPNARDQFESASKFIRQARQAIIDKNFVYAKTCADKAAILLSLLVKAPTERRAEGRRQRAEVRNELTMAV